MPAPDNYLRRLQEVIRYWKTDLDAAPSHAKVVTCTQLNEDVEVLEAVGSYIDSLNERVAVLERENQQLKFMRKTIKK